MHPAFSDFEDHVRLVTAHGRVEKIEYRPLIVMDGNSCFVKSSFGVRINLYWHNLFCSENKFWA
jgi:hypothetical protein